MIQCAQKVKTYENTIGYLKKNVMKYTITVKELETLKPDHRTYRALGISSFQLLTLRQDVDFLSL